MPQLSFTPDNVLNTGGDGFGTITYPGQDPQLVQQQHLENLLKVAQLHNLLAQPGLEERRLGLQERGLTQSGDIANTQNATTLRGQDLGFAEHKLSNDTTVRGQDLTFKNEELQRDAAQKAEALRATTTTINNLADHVANRGDVSTEDIASLYAKAGHPEFAQVLQEKNEKKLQTILPQKLAALKATLGTSAYPTVLADVTKDADVAKRLKEAAPELFNAAQATSSDGRSLGERLGTQIHDFTKAASPVLNPSIAALYEGLTHGPGVLDSISKKVNPNDFYQALLGNKPKPKVQYQP